MAQDLTKIYQIDKEKGIVSHTIKANGEFFTGTAYLAEGDVWNEEKGKRIAKLKAILKMKRFFAKHNRYMIDYLTECQNYLTEALEYEKVLYRSIESLENKLSEATGLPIVEQDITSTTEL